MKILSDKSNTSKLVSTNVICDALNSAARELGIYDENGPTVYYDCTGNTHGENADAVIVPYELNFPDIILSNLGGRRFLGVSRDNLFFGLNAGYPRELSDYFLLGVDSNKYPYIFEEKLTNKFRFGAFSEENSRGCLEVTALAFCQEFAGNKDVELYIKGRSSSELFKTYMKELSLSYDVNIIHNDEEIDSAAQLEIAKTFNCCITINRSSTFNCRALECLSMGLPTIGNAYSGHREYMQDYDTALLVDYYLTPYTDRKVQELAEKGLRNHLFPREMHRITPIWAEPSLQNLRDKMVEMKDNRELRNKVSMNGRIMAEKLDWYRSAMQLRSIL